MKKVLHNKGIAPIIAIIIGLIIVAGIVGIVATQKKAPVSEESIFAPDEEVLPDGEVAKEEEKEEEQIAQIGNITSFVVVRPNFVTQGENLSAVEIYAIPTGTEITPAMYGLIGNMILQSTVGGVQTWTFPISQLPQGFLATDMYVRGYDMNNQAVGDEYLPVSGASALYDYLY